MSTESGYSNKKAYGGPKHKTLHDFGSSRVGQATAQLYLYERTIAIPITVDPFLSEDQKILYIPLDSAANIASKGDICRMTTAGYLESWEFEVIQQTTIDGLDVLAVWNVGTYDGEDNEIPEIGDEFKILRWVTASSNAEGALTVSPGPIKYVDLSATEQTVTPDRPLPVTDISAPKAFKVLDFSVDNVTDGAYVELFDDVGNDPIRKVQIFMSAGDPLYLAFGAPGAEADKFVIIPGGNGFVDLAIPARARVSVKAVVSGVTVNLGQLIVNLLG